MLWTERAAIPAFWDELISPQVIAIDFGYPIDNMYITYPGHNRPLFLFVFYDRPRCQRRQNPPILKSSSCVGNSRLSQLILVDTVNAHELRLEDKRRATGDRANAAITIAILRRNGEGPLLANTHVEQTLVPSKSM